MIDKNSVVKSARTIAGQVKSSDVFAHDRLNMLGDALEQGTNAYGWSSSDIYTMIDPESIVTNYKNHAKVSANWFVSVLETVRNAIIFLPIIVTWYGISQATTAYNLLINEAIKTNNKDLYSLPFLYLWQQQFNGHLPGYLTLSNIAGADVFILLVILALTLLAYMLSGINSSTEERKANRLRSDLVHIIATASLSLRSQPPLTSGDNLEQTAQRIDNMARDIASRFDTMAQNVTSRFTKMLTDVAGEFTQATRNTQSQMDTIVQALTKQLHEGGEYLISMGQLTSGTVQIAQDLQTVATDLKTTNQALGASINKLISPMLAISRQQVALVDSMNQSAGLLQSAAGSLDDLGKRQQKMSAELSDVLDSLTLAIEKFELLAKNQEQVVDQQNYFLQHLQEERDKQTELATLMSDATVKVKNALDEMHTGAVSLRSMSVDMNDLMRLQATMSGLPQGSVVGVSDILASYEKAARTMEGSGNSLAASAIAIHRASQQLRDVLDKLSLHPSQNGPHP